MFYYKKLSTFVNNLKPDDENDIRDILWDYFLFPYDRKEQLQDNTKKLKTGKRLWFFKKLDYNLHIKEFVKI